MYIKWMETCIKTKVLTICCCAGSGEEGVMEYVKRNKCVHKVDGHTQYLHAVVVQVVMKVSWKT